MIFCGTTEFAGEIDGRAHIYRPGLSRIERKKITDTAAEIRRFYESKKRAGEGIDAMAREAESEYGAGAGAIFDVHRMMLDDSEYCGAICAAIENDGLNCEAAIYDTCVYMRTFFEASENEYIRERYEDICDVSEQLLAVTSGAAEDEAGISEQTVLLCGTISCRDLFALRRFTAAVVSELGSLSSHQAFLAGIIGIPYICGIDGIVRADFEGAAVKIRAGAVNVLK